MIALLVLALLAGATGGAAQPDEDDSTPSPRVERVAGATRVETAVEVSRLTFEAADSVVLAGSSAIADALVGGPLAAEGGGPLLLTPPDELAPVVAEELARLGTRRAVLLGGESAIGSAVADALASDGLEVRRLAGATRVETAVAVAEEMQGWTGAFVASATAPVDAVVAGAVAAVQRRPVLLVQPDTVPPTVEELLQARGAQDLVLVGGAAVLEPAVAEALDGDGARQVGRLSGSNRYATAAAVHTVAVAEGLFDPATTWLASGTDEGGLADALAVAPAIGSAGGALLLVDGQVLGRSTAVAERLQAVAGGLEVVRLAGGTTTIAEDADEQVRALLRGLELPGGGRSLLPDRRLVALYGSHFSPALGVLGEQPPDDVGPRLADIVDPYRPLSDRPVLPAFDLIATIATSSAGPDGLYRARSTETEIQQWLDAARAQEAYLILDLQPGQSDFLTEAQVYEEFLAQPDVGLALDPEWHVEAPQTPGGGTIGSVDASEVNAVSAWLADLVAREGLPEKLFIVHNFRVDMITNRDELLARDGLATMLHMDGQGARATKLDSYRILRQEPPFWNGFKVFFDEDPNPFLPSEVLDLDPVPDLVSYQ